MQNVSRYDSTDNGVRGWNLALKLQVMKLDHKYKYVVIEGGITGDDEVFCYGDTLLELSKKTRVDITAFTADKINSGVRLARGDTRYYVYEVEYFLKHVIDKWIDN